MKHHRAQPEPSAAQAPDIMQYPGADEKAAGGNGERLPSCRHFDLSLGDHHSLQLVMPVPGAGNALQIQLVPVAGHRKQRRAVVDQLPSVGVRGTAAGHQCHPIHLLGGFTPENRRFSHTSP